MNSQNNQASFLYIHQIQAAGWKQQIDMLSNLARQLVLRQLLLNPSLLENMWLPLIRNNNLNVLQATVSTLRIWVDTYGFKNIRLKREIIKALIALANMGRTTIDQNVQDIIVTLYVRQAQEPAEVQRVPLATIDQERFNSSNNPTFLIGYQYSWEREYQEGSQEEEPLTVAQDTPPASLIMEIISETMKSCRKRAFALCLKILNTLCSEGWLQGKQFDELLKQVEEISRVIEHRRLPNDTAHDKEARLAQEIGSLVAQLKIYNS